MEVIILTTLDILKIAFVMYLICLFLYFRFRIKWILITTSVLWFIPILLVDNLMIVVFSVIMIIITIVISLFTERNDEF
jgi:hypothetical protein